jgi:hypothetical protein
VTVLVVRRDLIRERLMVLMEGLLCLFISRNEKELDLSSMDGVGVAPVNAQDCVLLA